MSILSFKLQEAIDQQTFESFNTAELTLNNRILSAVSTGPDKGNFCS